MIRPTPEIVPGFGTGQAAVAMLVRFALLAARRRNRE